MGRKIRDIQDARASLAAWEASSLALGVWAREQGIDGRSLHCWKLNLRGRTRAPARLVELVPAPRSMTARYTVRFDGIELELGDDFRDDTLGRLLQVLAPC